MIKAVSVFWLFFYLLHYKTRGRKAAFFWAAFIKTRPKIALSPVFEKRGLKSRFLAPFFTRGLSPALKPRFMCLWPRFLWAGLRPRELNAA